MGDTKEETRLAVVSALMDAAAIHPDWSLDKILHMAHGSIDCVYLDDEVLLAHLDLMNREANRGRCG